MYSMDHVRQFGGLMNEKLSRLHCTNWGLVMRKGKNWDASDKSTELSYGSSFPEISLSRDERGAPYFAHDERILCSISDENGICLCVWSQCAETSPLRGIGVDLAAEEDFVRRPELSFLLLEDKEIQLAESCFPSRALGYAYAFSAKEAAFKSTASALRAWYRENSETLLFDVRNFEQITLGQIRGTAHGGDAQKACKKLGIVRIEASYILLPGMVCTLAFAYGA